MMKPLGKCIKCGVDVFEVDHYIKIEEHVEGKKEKTNYWHKKCFDEFINPKKLAYGMIGRTMNLLNKAETQLA